MLVPDFLSLHSIAGIATRFTVKVSNWVRMILLSSIVLTYGGLFWMLILHERRGMEEQYHLAPVLHWLRDASLAFRAVLVAVIVGMSLWRKSSQRLLPSSLRKPGSK